MKITQFLAITFIALSASIVQAHSIEVQNSWIRATAPGQKNTAIFMTLKNSSDKDVSLTQAQTTLASKVELHNHVKEGDVFKMRAVDKIVVPAKGEVILKPGSLHIMLFDISAQVAVDQEFPVTLMFEQLEPIKLTISAKQK